MRSITWDFWNPTAVIQMAQQNALDKMDEVCDMLLAKIKAKMNESKSGREYYIKGLGKHIASAPGESPARQFNILYNALTKKVWVYRGTVMGAVGVNLDSDNPGYAIYLEMGTEKMKPRPYLRNTLFESESEIKRIFGI